MDEVALEHGFLCDYLISPENHNSTIAPYLITSLPNFFSCRFSTSTLKHISSLFHAYYTFHSSLYCRDELHKKPAFPVLSNQPALKALGFVSVIVIEATDITMQGGGCFYHFFWKAPN
jgi:hypothetical protein